MAERHEIQRFSPSEPTLPAVHALHLAEVLALWGIGPEQLFAGLPLSPEALAEPNARLSLPMVEKLADRARELSGEPGLGFHLGLKMRISAHGSLGFAAMTSGTLREAIEVAVRFAPTRTNALSLELHEDGEGASLVVREEAPLGRAREMIVFALLTGIAQLGGSLTGQKLMGSVDFAFPEPSYFRRFDTLVGAPMRFDQPSHRLLFDSALLSLPLTLHDPAAARLAREQCERELEALGQKGELIFRVRALLPRPDRGFRSLDEVAKALGVSPRTLKRQLAGEGAKFSQLLEEQRRERATLLLRASELRIEEIAERLGYSDPANFVRAFRKWTGMTPRAFRISSTAAR